MRGNTVFVVEIERDNHMDIQAVMSTFDKAVEYIAEDVKRLYDKTVDRYGKEHADKWLCDFEADRSVRRCVLDQRAGGYHEYVLRYDAIVHGGKRFE